MKHLKLFLYSLLGSIYIRIVIGYIRWVYYYKILNRYRYLKIKNSISGTIMHNKAAFVKFPLTDFTMYRMDRLISVVKSIEFINTNSDFLIIGPRTESDVFKLMYNYPGANIESIDIITYSPWIKLSDAHNTNFDNNSFDCILSGWVIKYSEEKEKMLLEMIRIIKNRGLLLIGFEYYNNHIRKIDETSSKFLKKDDKFDEINSTKDITHMLEKNKIDFSIMYEYDALLKKHETSEIYNLTKMHSTQVMVCYQINKLK